jgi:hypothetical protein
MCVWLLPTAWRKANDTTFLRDGLRQRVRQPSRIAAAALLLYYCCGDAHFLDSGRCFVLDWWSTVGVSDGKTESQRGGPEVSTVSM